MVEVAGGFASFADANYRRLIGTLTLYCGDQEVAEELAHDALVRACERWGEVSQMTSPGAWLHRVAVNLANSYFRRKRAERRALRRAGREVAAGSPDRDVAVLVRRAISQLPTRQREAVILRYFHDLPVVDAAALMGITDGSMKQLTHRALTSLRADPNVSELIGQEAHDGV